MSTDRSYTDIEQSGAKAKRVGDITGEPPTNKAADRDKASKLANLLESLEFPATKEEIRSHLKSRSPSAENMINDALEAIESNLDDGVKYGSAYDVEVATGLVKKAGVKKPYVRDRANKERVGESVRPDPYPGREKVGPASSRNVSPNTPKGEEV